MDSIDLDIMELQAAAEKILADVAPGVDTATSNSAEFSNAIRLAHGVPKLLARAELDRMMLEAKDETIARQAALLATLEFPVLVLDSKVLCAPIIGPIDFERGQRLMTIALEASARRSPNYFILDLTGAVVEDPVVANSISDVTRAVGLIGVQVMMSGVRSDIAKMFIQCGELLAAIPTFPTLAAALGSIAGRKGRRS